MSGYIGTAPVPQAVQRRESFTATAGQTVFNTIGYSSGFVDVYRSGLHFVDGDDYVATNGSDVVLTVGAAAGDIVEVISFEPFNVIDQSFSGTTSADVLNVTGDFTSVGIDDNSTSTAITIDASENVGIGTTSPTKPLTVAADGNVGITMRRNTASDRFNMFVGDGTNGTAIDQNYIASNNTALNFWGGNPATNLRMKIDVSGIVTTPYQPGFTAYGSSGSTAFNGIVTVPYNSVSSNIGSHYSTSTYRFTAPVSGMYSVAASFLEYASASTGDVTIWISLNGASYTTSSPMSRGTLNSQQTLGCGGQIYLLANDYISVSLQGTGTYYTASGHAQFSAYLLG